MEISVSNQFFQALSSIVLGIAIGFFYDFLKIIRIRVKQNLITYIVDIIFWVVVGFAVFMMSMVVGQGELRIFMITSTVIGAALYFITMSRFTIKVCNKLVDIIVKILQTIAAPFIRIYKFIKKIMKKLKKHFKNSAGWGKIRGTKLFRRNKTKDKGLGVDYTESQKGKYSYESNRIGADSLFGGDTGKHERKDKSRRRKASGDSRRNRRSGTGKRRDRVSAGKQR